MTLMTTLAGWFGVAPRDPNKGKQGSGVAAGRTARPVTFDAAMTVGACFAASRLVCETISGLPLTLYEKQDDGSRIEVTDHPIINLLKYRPNRRQTRIEFFETFMLNLVNSGNAYCLRGYGDVAKTRLVSLQVINSGSITPELLENGDIIFHWQKSSSKKVTLNESDIWHVKLFGTGIIGLSPLAAACKSIGVALAAADRVTDLMEKEAPPGSLNMPAGIWPNKDQRDTLRAETIEMVKGKNIPIFGGGAKFDSLQMTPAELELISTLRFSLEDIARIYGVPSVLINDQSASTVWGSGIDSLINASYKFNFRPYLEKIELSMLINLLPMNDWSKYEFEFDFNAILRSSKKDRVEMYAKEIQTGQSTPNECRLAEGKTPKPGGDKLLVPVNVIDIENLGRVIPKTSKEVLSDAA